LYGGYAQAGWFPNDRWSAVPDKLEVAFRVAYIDPDSPEDLQDLELTFGVNWFISGHRNKLSFDTTYLEAESDGERESDYRFQLQWDVSI